MSYVSWPNVASTSYVDARVAKIPNIYLSQLTVQNGGVIATDSSWSSPVITTEFLDHTVSGLVCIELDASYHTTGTGADTIAITILNHDRTGVLFTKTQRWMDGPGGGSRSSVILPLMCVVPRENIVQGFVITIVNSPRTGNEPLTFESPLQIKITQHF